jgi:hypothetical protein
MGGQAHFKHAKAMGVGSSWMKIRRGVRRKKTRQFLVETIVVWVTGRAYRNV